MSDVVMPQLGETVTEGTITKWFKQVGEPVARDEVLFEVSTDKVDSEVPSPIAGVLTEIKVPEGDTVDVGEVLAVIADGEAVNAAAPSAAAAATPEAVTEPSSAPGPEPVSVSAAAPTPVGESASDSSHLLSPVVRKLISENGLDVDSITGSGVGGRITRADVEAAIQERGPVAKPAAGAAPALAPVPAVAEAAELPRSGERDTAVPLNNIRKLTGEHMVRSKATSPHVLTAVEVDFENVERVRQRHRADFKSGEGFSLTYLPFISRAVCDAIREYPKINASVGENELIVHNYVNLAIAVDLDFDGLLAPVIQDADAKRLRAIARETVDLAQRARTKKLAATEVTGGTFTITNPGQYGTMMQFPIINQPQVAILSTDGISRKPVVVTDRDGNEAIAIHSVGVLALAWDHRAFDGAYVAAFLDHLRTIIETRDWETEIN